MQIICIFKAKMPRMFPKKGFMLLSCPEMPTKNQSRIHGESRISPDGKCWAGFGALVLTSFAYGSRSISPRIYIHVILELNWKPNTSRHVRQRGQVSEMRLRFGRALDI